MITLVTTYLIYGTLVYAAYGNMEAQNLFQVLPQTQPVSYTALGYVFVTTFTYPIYIFPANKILESCTIEKFYPT